MSTDITSTIDGSKWFHGIDAAKITELGRLCEEINQEVHTAVVAAAKGQIRIGQLLLQAREIFPSDGQFGKWRAENTPITSKESANKLMNLARQLNSGRITETMVNSLPVSTLKELLTAPDSVIQAVSGRIEAGDPPTKDEAREMVRESKSMHDDGDRTSLMDDLDALDRAIGGPEARERTKAMKEASEQRKKDAPAPKEPSKPEIGGTPGHVSARVLAMDTIERIKYLTKNNVPYSGCKEIEWAWMVLGLDPIPSANPNAGVPKILMAHYTDIINFAGGYEKENLIHTLELAMEYITAEY